MTGELQTVMDLFEQNREDYLTEARSAAESLANERGVITVNDVREVCPPPKDVDPRVMGAIFRSKAWEKVGYISSTRAHMRPIAQFRLRV